MLENKVDGLDIIEYEGNGYQSMMHYGAWRIAMATPSPQELGQPITVLSRHMETDEVFVLLKGGCTLYTAGAGESPSDIILTEMEPFKLYNIRKCTWHARVLSPDAQVLIVENDDTSNINSESVKL